MTKRVMEAISSSGIESVLTEAEIRTLAAVGRIEEYETGADLATDGPNRNVYILRRGHVALHICMQTDGGRCGGEVTIELATRGAVFGWAAWVRPERVAVTASAVEPTSLAVLNLDRLRQSPLYWKVSQWMVYRLYALMQQAGLCPPNIPALLELRDMHVWREMAEFGLATESA